MSVRRPRFRLAWLFIVVAMVALGLTTWIWRSEKRMEAARELTKNEVGFAIVSDKPEWLPDTLSQADVFRRPGLAEIYVHLSPDGRIEIQEKTFELDSAKERLLALRQEIAKSGTDNVHLLLVPRDCSIGDIYGSESGRQTAVDLMNFANAQGFSSVATVDDFEVDERRQNLDPKGHMRPDSGSPK